MSQPRVIIHTPAGVEQICARHPPNSVDPTIDKVNVEKIAVLHASTIAMTDQKTDTRHNAIDPNGHMTKGMMLLIPKHDEIREQVPAILF